MKKQTPVPPKPETVSPRQGGSIVDGVREEATLPSETPTMPDEPTPSRAKTKVKSDV